MGKKKAGAAICLSICSVLWVAGCSNGVQKQEGLQGGGAAAYREDVSVQTLEQAVAEELGEEYWPDADIPQETLAETYGVAKDLYEEVCARMPLISAHVDTLILIKAKEGEEETVRKALEAYRSRQAESAMQYPMNLGKIQAAQVARFGRYVCFVQLGGDITQPSQEGEEAVILHCQEENARALAVMEGLLAK